MRDGGAIAFAPAGLRERRTVSRDDLDRAIDAIERKCAPVGETRWDPCEVVRERLHHGERARRTDAIAEAWPHGCQFGIEPAEPGIVERGVEGAHQCVADSVGIRAAVPSFDQPAVFGALRVSVKCSLVERFDGQAPPRLYPKPA